MHEYPKVLRYDDNRVPDDFWDSDLYLTEKTDGTNIRFQLFDERYAAQYSDAVHACDPADGDIVFGTRRNVRGCASDPLDTINGALHGIVQKLRSVDSEAIRRVHDSYGPVVWFAEGMTVYSSLDYGHTDDVPHPLVGFDVYAMDEDSRESVPANPFEQTFEGFLPTETALALFDEIGVQPVEDSDDIPVVDGQAFSPEEYEFPESQYGDVTIEGVVLRNDALSERSRVKLVREEFHEINREAFGYTEDDAESPEEQFVAIFCPNARIQKIARKYAEEQGVELSKQHIDAIWRRVYTDIWQEEWAEIKDLDFAFTPAEVKPLVAKRTAAVIEQMVRTAEMNDVRPRDVW